MAIKIDFNRLKVEAIEYCKTIDKKKVATAILLLFLVVFLFNLFKFNRKFHVDKAEMAENRKTVESLQKASVKDVEEAVDAVGGDVAADASSSKARYMRMFQGSVVVGDSVTEGISLYGWLNESQVFSKVGSSVLTGDDLFKQAANTYPKQAFFAFGMNDMGNFRGNADNFVKKYNAQIKTFKTISPKTRIYICGISTPSDSALEKNSSIRDYKKFNKAIKKMCEKKGYKYIPVADILVDHPELYAGDGIHAQTAYYPYWLNRMIEEAGL